ncbi:hypothetical protein V6N12_056617 [Hibiscus sabdariffa]|uniref:Uncharacterized protein n=1 Tax=Hibiscus sabdariffa TaxID=183260 RepID=A0ABR2CT14_9ROSI
MRETAIPVYLLSNAMKLEQMVIGPQTRHTIYKELKKEDYISTNLAFIVMALHVHHSIQCQVPPRVPPNTSVGLRSGSDETRPHHPSEVIKGTPEDS